MNELVEQAFAQNLTLREAGRRIEEAQRRRDATAGNIFPQWQVAEGSFRKSALSSTNANFIRVPGVFEPDLHPRNYATGLAMAWELDFWGKYRRSIEVADASLDATIAAGDEVALILVASVADAYVAMRMFEQRQLLAEQNLEIQRLTFELTSSKRDIGLASDLDVAQAEANLGQTEALLPLLETGRRQASNRLCLLLGRTPTDLAAYYGATAEIPQPRECLSVGLPADLLRNRPDVRQAERNLAAQSARIGIAQTDLYPQLSLIGQAGLSSQDFGKMFTSASQVGAIVPGFSWKIFNYSRLRNNIRAEQAAFLKMCYAYQQTVLQAQTEVEDAQIAFINSFDRANALQRAAQAASVAVEKAQILYEIGSIDFTNLYVLQADLLSKQDHLAQARAEIAFAAIELLKAGGISPQCSADWLSTN